MVPERVQLCEYLYWEKRNFESYCYFSLCRKMLTGQVVQTTGRVILSQAMSRGKEYDKVGVCAQDNILIPNLTAREHLELYAKIKLKRNYQSEVEKTLKDLNFGKHENYQASQLSGGYKRRLCVAISFIGKKMERPSFCKISLHLVRFSYRKFHSIERDFRRENFTP